MNCYTGPIERCTRTQHCHHPDDSPPLTKSYILKVVASKVAFLAFSFYACYCCPVPWGYSFFVGIIFRHDIKRKITDLFGKIMWSPLALQLVPPSAILIHWFLLPNLLVMQAVMAGAALGSSLALSVEDLLNSNLRKNLLNLFVRV